MAILEYWTSGDIWLVLALFWFSFQSKRNWCSWETLGKWSLFFHNQRSWILSKCFLVKKKMSRIAFTKQCFLVMCLLHYQGWKKYLNSSFHYGQLAPKCFFPRVMVCLFLLSFFMTWLANNLPYTRLACLPVWQVTRKSYMP